MTRDNVTRGIRDRSGQRRFNRARGDRRVPDEAVARRGRPVRAAVALSLALCAVPAAAIDFSDPSWPCIQRKVERLSPGLMWPHPIVDVAIDAEAREAADDLVTRLALRRVPVEDLRADVDAFAAAHGAGSDLLGAIFSRVFDRLAATRRTVMGGIGDYSLSQVALSERIGAARDEMDRLMALDEPDFDRVDALEEQIDWDERIYDERRRSLTYVCETPVLIEKRLYAIAQLLAGAVEGG